MAAVCAGGIGSLLLGFIEFADGIVRLSPAINAPADGIVVLTGGQSRVAEAVRLLAQGKARRLLISGVDRENRKQDIRRALAMREPRLFDCCVDLGYRAIDTISNAAETRAWAREKGFKSLIVVTSSYHMPRSLGELQHALPDVQLIPYPVMPRNFRIEAWWAYPGTAHLLMSEYLKYVRAGVRRWTAQRFPATTVSALNNAPVVGPATPAAARTRSQP